MILEHPFRVRAQSLSGRVYVCTMSWKHAFYNSGLARAAYRTPVGRFIYHLPEEIRRTLRGDRNPMVPPMWRVFTGRGDFLAVGREFVGHYKTLGGLKPEHSVLEVGCGMGRMAVALTEYLSQDARYEGLDIVPDGIRWCASRITPRHPKFRFTLADVRNDLYRKRSGQEPERYRFPYPDASFDFVTLGSVFTHMGPAAIRNYLSEIGRVLKPGGTCLITWYVLDEASLRLIAENRSRLAFRHHEGPLWSVDPKHPEHDTAFEYAWIMDAYRDAGLTPEPVIHFGYWSGRSEWLSAQDIVVAHKPKG
jgi:SAM-dependent methyltransferase